MNVVSEVSTSAARTRLGFGASWALLLVLAAVMFAAVAVPVFLIMPFRHQSPTDLEVSYALRRWSPWATLAGLAVMLVLAARVWSRSRRWWSKAALVVPFVPALVAVWFAQQNHFEWMFRPLPKPAYVRVEEANFVNDDDMVLAVTRDGDAVAYPVRQVAYHHVVEDTVGGAPIVVTY